MHTPEKKRTSSQPFFNRPRLNNKQPGRTTAIAATTPTPTTLFKTSCNARLGKTQRKENERKQSLPNTATVTRQDGCDDDGDDVGGRGRRLFVVRHGERVDFTFGSDWIQRSFDAQGNYVRFDMNMPKSVPLRKGGLQDYIDDSPLTTLGLFQARLLGESMFESGIIIDHVYSSPALRCVQTAGNILSGYGISKSICVEPGVFEWMAWHQNGLPKFMTNAELIESGFNVDVSHETIWNTFDVRETIADYYDRCHKVTTSIVNKHTGGNILIVSHKGSVDVCVRQLVGCVKLPLSAFRERVSKVPYCGVSCCRQGNDDGKWKLVSPGLPSFTHAANKGYDWRMWL